MAYTIESFMAWTSSPLNSNFVPITALILFWASLSSLNHGVIGEGIFSNPVWFGVVFITGPNRFVTFSYLVLVCVCVDVHYTGMYRCTLIDRWVVFVGVCVCVCVWMWMYLSIGDDVCMGRQVPSFYFILFGVGAGDGIWIIELSSIRSIKSIPTPDYVRDKELSYQIRFLLIDRWRVTKRGPILGRS